MKKFVLIGAMIISSIIFFQSCDNEVKPVTDCPLYYPVQTDPNLIPIDPEPKGNPHIFGLSKDGDKLACEGVGLIVLNLRTGHQQIFTSENFQSRVPSNVIISGITDARWCPYDNNKLLIKCITYTDTVGDGKHFEWGGNLYIISLDGKEFKKITPPEFGPAGGDFSIESWLNGSTPNEDHILFLGNLGIYVPQKDQWLPKPVGNDHVIFEVSPNNQYYFCSVALDSYRTKFVINDVDIKFSENPGGITHSSFSPNGKKLAVSVWVKEVGVSHQNRRFHEIWLIDVEKVMQERPAVTPVSIINIRQNFCMYAYDISATFLTDSTLAVSMFGPYEDCGHIYEISTSGKMIRQLTFEP